QYLGPALREARTFRFTDKKQSFLDKAPALVAKGTNLVTQLLDINDRPDTFPEQDVIFGTNVLHVAHDIMRAMYWLKSMLSEGGYLIIGEGAPYSDTERWPLDLIFALFPDWWDVPPDSIRRHPGFLTPTRWRLLGAAC